MCGIAGIYRFDGAPLDRAVLARVRDAMTHRGPDDAGLFISEQQDVGLAHRRLSILDLTAAGHQPMRTEDGALTLVFNGEIYNFQALRQELEGRGHVFRGRSDTEVLLRLWREQGAECLPRLEGMFAFAVYDARDRKLYLARDRIGVKPLTYVQDRARFAFASETKALFAAGLHRPALDRQSVHHYLTFATAPAPRSLFEGVHKLEASTLLTLDRRGALQLRRWWKPWPSRTGAPVPSLRDAAAEVGRRLSEATRLRMITDVPFGAYLSGGVDSTTNVALMTRLLHQPVRTFSVSAPGDGEADELDRARAAAVHFGSVHSELRLTPGDFLDALPALTYHLDEPVADPASVPLFHLSRVTRDAGVKVVQVGEGSDEVFFGYPHYATVLRIARTVWRAFGLLPGAFRQMGAYLASGLPAYIADAVRRAAEREPIFWGGAIGFWETEKRALWRDGAGLLSSASVLTPLLEEGGRPAALEEAICAVELRLRLPELILMRLDKMTMAHSVEAREPYLDHHLVEYGLNLPLSLKLAGGVGKAVLREAVRPLIPEEVLRRPKVGFCGSATTMVRGDVRAAVVGTLRHSPLVRDLFDAREIDRLIHRSAHQPRQNNFKLWVLFSLAMWREVFFGGDAQALLAEARA